MGTIWEKIKQSYSDFYDDSKTFCWEEESEEEQEEDPVMYEKFFNYVYKHTHN